MIDYTADGPPTLYHATPTPEGIEAEGLKPCPCRTAAYDAWADHPDPEMRKVAAQHEGPFIFATPSRLLADVYAFKISAHGDPNFRGHMFRCGTLDGPDGKSMVAAVVADAEAFLEALEKLNPTRFTIRQARGFEPVFTPDENLTGEWVSRQPVAAKELEIERLNLSALSGRVQFFELAPSVFESLRANPNFLKDRETPELFEKGLLLPANHKLGLPPVLSHTTRAGRVLSSGRMIPISG